MRLMVAERGTGEPISLGGALMTGKKVAPDALNLLMDDHRVVLGWFEWFEKCHGMAVEEQILRQICTALLAHMAAEEEVFYPEVEAATGEAELVKEAVKEHKGAKTRIRKLEKAKTIDDEARKMVRTLWMEIAHHVEEEEGKLFPEVRQSDLDLYQVGRLLAARRVDALFKMVGRPKRADGELSEVVMPVAMDEARNFFLLGLKNAHAAARQSQTMLEMQVPRLDDFPEVQARLETHRQQIEAQLERLENLLERYGESRSALKEAALSFAAGVSGMAATAADDEVLKNSFAMDAQARFLASAYESLLVLGEAAGEAQALRPIQQSLSEVRGIAMFLEENLRATTVRFLQLRTAAAR